MLLFNHHKKIPAQISRDFLLHSFVMKKAFLILACLCVQSCCCINVFRFPYLGIYNHSKGNDIEDSHYDQMKILQKCGLDTLNNYELKCSSIDSLNSVKYMIDKRKLENGGGAAMIQLRMFDNNGDFVGGCGKEPEDRKSLEILDSLPFKKIPQLHTLLNIKLIDDIRLLRISQEQTKRLLSKSKNYDYTILALYAGWEGWNCRSTLKHLSNYLKKHKDKKILVITVNTSKPC